MTNPHLSGDSDRSGSDSASERNAPFGAQIDSTSSSSTSTASSDRSGGEPEGGSSKEERPRRRSRRRGSRGGRRRRGETSEATSSEEAPSASAGASATKPRRARSGRSRSGGAKSTAPESGADQAPDAKSETSATGAEASDRSDGKKRSRRRRGARGGRRRSKRPVGAVEIEALPGEEDELPELIELPAETELIEEGISERSGRRGRRKSSKKAVTRKRAGRGKAASEDATDSDAEGSSTSGRKRRGSRSKATSSTEAAKPGTGPSQIILVNAVDPEETRVAVIEEGKIVDFQMSVRSHTSYVNDIFRGRVVNLEPTIGAAFIDFGQGKNGFLHASDVLSVYGDEDWNLESLFSTRVDSDEWEGEAGEIADDDDDAAEGDDGDGEDGDGEEKPTRSAKSGGRGKAARGRGRQQSRRPRLAIEKLLTKGQVVVTQITKDAIGDKGPALTTYLSIPGRYIVLMPSLSRIGVSRKIEDPKERKRLKRILDSMVVPEGMGVIVRTAGIGRNKTELKRDLEYLLATWEDFCKRMKTGRYPASLYHESDVAIRTMRDLFTERTEKVIVDDEKVYLRMVEFAEALMPECVERIEMHSGARPIFNDQGIEQDYERIFSRRLELPSGGSIVIDQTEALVAIDVNSGRTRQKGAGFEDIALKANLEAVDEAARQIQLRDLGGIIVIDFIDMLRSSGRQAVERALRDRLGTSRARSKIGRISQFGLLELTRQRLGPGVSKLVHETCEVCRGSGHQRTAASRAQAILRRLGTAMTLKGFTKVDICAHADALALLQKGDFAPMVERLQEESGRTFRFVPSPDQVEDSVLHYFRADGREVRPGGRRKR